MKSKGGLSRGFFTRRRPSSKGQGKKAKARNPAPSGPVSVALFLREKRILSATTLKTAPKKKRKGNKRDLSPRSRNQKKTLFQFRFVARRSTASEVPAEILPDKHQDKQPDQELPEVSQPVTSPPPLPEISLVPPPVESQALPAIIPPPESPPQLAFPGFAPLALSTQEVLKPSDTLRQSIEAFLMDQRSPHTRRAYGKDLKRFVKYLQGRKLNQGVETLNRLVLIGYKESLLTEGLEHTTVDRHLATLRSFFNWLVDDGLILKSPADGVRFLNPRRLSTTQGFSDEEVKRVLTVPDLHTRTGALHYAILMVLFYCGLRRSEICGLKTTNLGTERNQRVLRLRGKGNAERMIVMIPAVWNSVRYYLYISGRDLEGDQSLFMPIRNNRTGVVKKPLDPSMIFYIVRKYAKQAGIMNRVSPHSCRATAISNARDHHVPDRAIQEFAGWASTDMITRYDKRRTSVEESAAHSIIYGGTESRTLPQGGEQFESSFADPAGIPEEKEQARDSHKDGDQEVGLPS